MPEKKNRRGPARIYACRIPVRVTKDEKASLERKAKESGVKSLSRYLVQCGLATSLANNFQFDEKALEAQERAIFELSRIGHNLNQLTRRINNLKIETASLPAKQLLSVIDSLSVAMNDLKKTFGGQ